MPSKMKDLYVAQSFNDLKDKNTSIRAKMQKSTIERLPKNAEKLYIESLSYKKDGDEEMAYLFSMRCAEAYAELHKRAKEGPWKEKFLSVLLDVEKLSTSLEQRYEDLNKSKTVVTNGHDITDEDKTELKRDDSFDSDISVITKELSIASLEDRIKCETLYNLMDGRESFIIMDVRSSRQYLESHIKNKSCINIPSDYLKPGATARCIEKLLKEEQKSLWSKRHLVDYVILIDWKSSSQYLSLHSPLQILRDAIDKWDENSLKSAPFILEGGYEEWLLCYPATTTNPRFKPDSPKQTADFSKKLILSVDYDIDFLNDEPKKNDILSASDSLSDFEYIDSEMDIGLPSPSLIPSVDRSSKPKTFTQQNNYIINKPSFETKYAWPKKEINAIQVHNGLGSEETAADKELQNTEDRLRKEMEFQTVCARLSSEADASIIESLKSQQEKILLRLKEFEDETVRLEKENSQLKKEKAKEKIPDENDMLVQKHLKQKQAKKEQLDAEVAKLREERKKNQEAILKMKLEPTNVEHATMADNLVEAIAEAMEDLPISNQRKISPSNSVEAKTSERIERLRSEPRETLKRGLSRSHSSPNINELVDPFKPEPTIDRALKPRMPPFERTLKPLDTSAARQRDLNPVYSSHGKGKAGLKNLGNTCFMNSVIQCLHSTRPLSNYLISKEYVQHVNKYSKEGTQGRVIEELSIIIDKMSYENYRSIAPSDFKNTVSRYLHICVGYEQQDAHEFLTYLMEKLHGDINSVSTHSKTKQPDIEKMDGLKATQIFWEWHTTFNNSRIVDLFEGVLQSRLTCLHCGAESNNYEVFSCLSVPIPNQSRCTLRDCMESLLKAEKICGEAAWDCPNCKQKREAEKRMVICKLPPILIIHLKRFYYKGVWRQKLQTFVDFPIQELDMKPYMLHKDANPKYQAYGVVNHYGTMEGGHYTAYCRSLPNDHWLKCDDQDISDMSSKGVKTSAAYILFYSSF